MKSFQFKAFIHLYYSFKVILTVTKLIKAGIFLIKPCVLHKTYSSINLEATEERERERDV